MAGLMRRSPGTSSVRVVVGEGILPPLLRITGGLPFRKRVDGVDRARREALVAPRAQLGNDHHVGAVVEDRAEMRRAGPQARVAVDALAHLDAHREVLPPRVALALFDALDAGSLHGWAIHGEEACSTLTGGSSGWGAGAGGGGATNRPGERLQTTAPRLAGRT